MQGLFLEDLTVGQSAEMTRTADERTVQLFAEVSGDNNPLHLDEAYAQTTQFKGRIAHGMLSAAHISAVIGTQLPGPGAVYVGQTLSFRRPVRIGDEVRTLVTIREIDADKGRVTLDTVCSVNGKAVLTGEALILAPKRG
ncbi:MAG: MaoC family protein/phosphate acetyl/butaryl transferase [Caulobacter sp.]|nr:MaoC family protein/phosphate acetyl/butaryl transferase [Caulobacter sp.]